MHEIDLTSEKPLSAYLIGLRRPGMTIGETAEHLDELKSLAGTYGIPALGEEMVVLREITPRFLVGSGKAEQIAAAAEALGAGVIIFDDDLSPSQQRNWETLTNKAVI